MPTVRRNVIKKKLTAKERGSFEAFGRSEADIDLIEEKLHKEAWTFWCDASELYMTLTTGQSIIYEGGKQKTVDECSGCKFTNNYFDTRDREAAKNIFLSDLYFEGRIREVEDHVAAIAEEKYHEFRGAVMADPANVKRLKKDLADMQPVEA